MKYVLYWIAICVSIDVLYIVGKVILGIVIAAREESQKKKKEE